MRVLFEKRGKYMKKAFAFLLIPTILLTLSCQFVSGLGKSLQGSGNVVTESRQVSGFDSISVCCSMRLILTQGNSESLEIEADDNLLPEIESVVTNGTLIVRFKDSFSGIRLFNTSPIIVRVSAIQVNGVDVSGGGRLDAAGPIQTSGLTMDFSGGSRGLMGKLQADTLSVDMSGGSRMELAGSTAEQNISLSGGSDYLAGDLQSQAATLDMSGGGRATLWVTEIFNVDLSGGSVASYYGSPSINQNLSGGSHLQSLGEK
jgi:hypothetical protein